MATKGVDVMGPVQTGVRRRPAGEFGVSTSTLAGEHALLLRDVRRRAAPVLALTAARSWPDAEVRTLTRFLRTAVLRQVSDEEAFLYPSDRSAPFAELSAEHVQLHSLTDQLDQADATSCPLEELRELVEQILRVLEHHLVQEQALLAALPHAPGDVPAAADLVAGTRSWAPPDDAPALILFDTLPAERAVQICVERLLRLRPGQSAEIRARREHDVQRVCRWVHGFDSSGFGIAWQSSSADHAAVRVTRRNTT